MTNEVTKKEPKFEVFKGVALVTARRGNFGGVRAPQGSIYPVEGMEIGDSFPVLAADNAPETLAKLARTVASSVSRLAKNLGYKTAIRALPQSDDPAVNPWGEACVGVWRVSGVYTPREPKAAKAA